MSHGKAQRYFSAVKKPLTNKIKQLSGDMSFTEAVSTWLPYALNMSDLETWKRLIMEWRSTKPWLKVREVIVPDTTEVTGHEYYLKAPWPQPSPHAPGEMPSTVLHVPQDEIDDFLHKVVQRYVQTLRTEWPEALVNAFKQSHLDPVSDHELMHIFLYSPFSRYLNSELDSQDKQMWQKQLDDEIAKDPEAVFYKIDFSGLKEMECIAGLYVAPTVTLVKKSSDGSYQVLGTSYDNHWIAAADNKNWQLIKFFILQGAALQLIVGTHPRVHFPMDAINAVTKTLLSPEHRLYRLLEPHLYMQLPLNFAVLYIRKSVAHNNPSEIYTPFPCTKEGFFKIVAQCYQGLSDNSSYPNYNYQNIPPGQTTDYGRFLNGYYEIIKNFVSQVLDGIDPKEEKLQQWANEIAKFVPGFPDGHRMAEPGQLASAVTNFIYDVSVLHSADHYGYSELSITKVPLRLRVDPKKALSGEDWQLEELNSWTDIFRHHMARKMYFYPTVITPLTEVNYNFDEAHLKNCTAEFHKGLRDYDRHLSTYRYVPLREIASSIQY